MRKLSFLLVLVLTMTFCTVPTAAAYTPSFEVTSEAVYLLNLNTGDVVYEKNADQKMYPASTTKLMTAILAFELCEDIKETTITAPAYIYDEFYGLNVSTGDIRKGEEMTVELLIYAMLMASANEAASIIADYYGDGSIAHFAEMMTTRAKELGCTGTNFVNAHGLFHEDHYTTAKDMAIIAKHALSIPGFSEIASTTQYNVGVTNKHSELIWHTTNKMLLKSSEYYYAPVSGLKTGTLDESGRCFVSTASLDGYDYLLVILGAPIEYDAEKNIIGTSNTSFKEAKKLYQWAFENFSMKTLMEKGTEMTEVPLRLAKDVDYVKLQSNERFSALVPDDIEASSLVLEYNVPETVTAPVTKGQRIGEVRLILAGEQIGAVPLVASANVERSEVLYWLDQVEMWMMSFWFKFAVALIAMLIIMYIFIMVRRNRNKHTMYTRRRPGRR